MSILLDALKKSEEQRKLGATPDIHGSLATGPDDVVTVHQWLPLSMMAVSVIVMAWFGWQQYREPEMEAVVISPSAESEAGVEIPPGFGDQATRPYRRTAKIEPSDSGSESVGPGTGQRTPVESLPPAEESPGEVSEMPPAESPDSDAQLARLNESLATLQAAAEADENSGSGPRETSPEETLSRSPGAAKDPESGSGRSRVEPHIAEPISYWELPQGVRDNLPDFNITVMVYADNPADRFLLIDGDRLVEKEEWDSGVVLDEIRRDGAIFKYRKYRFLVKG